MATHFSNFEEDENDALGDSLTASGSSAIRTQSHSHRSIGSDHDRRATTTDATFDDFDSEWDFKQDPSAQQALSATSQHDSVNRQALARPITPGGSRIRQAIQSGPTLLELPNTHELEKRALSLEQDDDFDTDQQFGSKRLASLSETPSARSTGAMTLREFPATPSTVQEFETSKPEKEPKVHTERSSNGRAARFESMMPPMPQVQYEPFSVEPPSHYQNYLYLIKYIHGLKILCGVHMVRPDMLYLRSTVPIKSKYPHLIC